MAPIQDVRERLWRLGKRLGVAEREQVLRLHPSEDTETIGSSDGCFGCGASAAGGVHPTRSVVLWGERVPPLWVPLCERCLGNKGRGVFRAAIPVAAVFVVATVAGVGSVALANWAPLWSVVATAGLAGAAAWVVAARVQDAGRALRVSLRWVRGGDGRPVLESRGPAVGARARHAGAVVHAAERWRVRAAGSALAWAGAGLVSVPFAWTCAHPWLHVANLGASAWVLEVDGRVLALAAPVQRESPLQMVRVRVPRGWRRLQARGLDGNIVDARVVHVGNGAAHLYVPARLGRCLWVDEWAYGRTRVPRQRRTLLSANEAFYSFEMPIDAWFQANPEGGRGDRWFSGGVRRAVRHGPCGPDPTVAQEPMVEAQ